MKDWVLVRCRGCDEEIVLEVLEDSDGPESGLLAVFDNPYTDTFSVECPACGQTHAYRPLDVVRKTRMTPSGKPAD
jgi:uncharacterized Zn finger protein